MTAIQSMQRYTTTKGFRAGMGVAGAVYVMLFAWLWFNNDGQVEQAGHKLATQTVEIIREVSSPSLNEHTAVPTPIVSPLEENQSPEISAIDDVDEAVSQTSLQIPQQPNSAAADVHIAQTINAPIALPKAPMEGLSEDTPDGRLPKIREEDHMTPFEAYRRPFAKMKAGTPFISIGVIDFGLSGDASKQALTDLSPDVSMVMTPYTTSSAYWINEARNNGHEVWLEMPVETDDYPREDTGPQTLLISALERINMKKLGWILSQTDGYVGVVTPYQPAFMKSENDVRPVLNMIYERGLGFIDGATTISGPGQNFAYANAAIYDNADAWIDIPATPEHMAASLRQLEVAAQTSGSAIGMIHSTPEGLKLLQTWIDGLPQKNIAIVPLSAQMLKAK